MTPATAPGPRHETPGASPKGPSRRTALGVGGGLAVAATGTWAAGVGLGSTDSSSPRLRIGYLPITDAAPLLIGHARGLFEKHGARVEKPTLFRSWSSLSEAFVVGEVDAIHMLMPMALHMKYGLGADARITAWNHVNGSALTVKPEIDAVSDLAGTTVAIPAWWSVHNVVLQKLLRKEGLTPVIRKTPSPGSREVQLVVMAPSDMIPALSNGVISGFVVADPFNAGAFVQKVGKTLRYLGDVWKDHACCVTVMRGSLVDREPERAQAFMDGLVEAQSWTREHRAESATILSQNFLPQPLPAIRRALTDHAADFPGSVHHPTWGGQLIDFAPYPYASFTAELLTAMRDTVVDAPDDFLSGLDPQRAQRELIDTRLVTRAIEKSGGMSAFGASSTHRTEEIAP
ncbi:ABC transporter substrate-binding protein [Curtobacterium sp. S6]|uniref:ABC transporter substrate-binding protein n=1 Tax=Curtobacterium sp. S6 TaxID=1479623 RepID=UPI0009EA2127|nr:ABC transporter substrate-binding protein [Curtobacterium sp. S6]